MKRLLVALALLASCKSDPPTPTAVVVDKGPKLAFVPASAGDVATVVKSELERARAEQKRVLVYVGATWCEPCKRFHDAASSGALDERLPGIRFVEFDLDRDEDRLKAAGYSSQYIPLFAAPQGDGRASGKQIAGSVKGPGAPDEITPRLLKLLAEATGA